MKRFILLSLTLFAWCSYSINAQDAASTADFYDANTIQEINITFEQENWSYLLDSLRFNGENLLLGTVEINGEKFENAGVRYRGSKSFQPGGKRNGLHLKLNYINKNQNIQGHHSVKLSNSLRDPSMIREVISYEIARNYMAAPNANYAKISINGAPYGLLVNVEPVANQFLTKYFGTADNALFKVKQGAGEYTPEGCKSKIYGSLEADDNANCYLNNFEKLSEHGWDDLINLTNGLNDKAGNISSILNVDATLWMLAFNNVLVNLSSYSGQNSVNYYLYKDADGRFTPIIWDLNLSFGSFKNTGEGSDLKIKNLQELDPLLHVDNVRKPLISSLLQDENNRKTYLSHLRTIVKDHFSNDNYQTRANELQSLIRTEVASDPGQSYSDEDFQNSLTKTIGKRSKIPGIVELMDKRSDYLSKHRALSVFPPEISEVGVKGRPQFSSAKVGTFRINAKVDKFPKTVTLMYRLNGTGTFKEANMYDDGKNNDGAEADGIFGITIVPQNGENNIEYYIVAENVSLINYSPSNYMWEQHKSSLDDLNK